MIRTNIELVEEKICNACEKSGRKREEVTLIAVSKTKSVEMIKEAMKMGIITFGENKVQELVSKHEVLPSNINWHMIGHLQTNKVKYIIDKVSYIHSVDSFKLASQIDKEAAKRGIHVNILVEVNIGEEESKFGVSFDDVYDLVFEISKLEHVRVKGLMTVAPYVENPEENRPYFRKMRQLIIDIGSKNIDNVTMEVLSMGMSNDYEIAIEEGATMVRIGTGIFGERNYNIQ